MQNFMLSAKLIKKLQKSHQEKVTHKKPKHFMSKSQKVHFSLTILLITFLQAFMGNAFLRSEISIELCDFDTNFVFFQKYFFGGLSTFSKLWSEILKLWCKILKITFL